jgi:hypothetical protein
VEFGASLASSEPEALTASVSELELLGSESGSAAALSEQPTASNSQHHLFFSNAHFVFLWA